VIFIALKSGKTFYLAVALVLPDHLRIRNRVMTAKTAPKITLWEFFQQLGKTFMLPVALLSFCGIMLGIGSSLSSHDVLTLLPWLDMPLLQAIFIWMSKVGSFAFSFLPVMFCIAIPLGLARENKGVAAFAGFVGYAVMNLAVNFWLTAKGILPTTDAAILKANNIQNIIGIPVDRYRDPRGGDRRDYRLDAARALPQYPPAGRPGLLRRHPLRADRHHRGAGSGRSGDPAGLAGLRHGDQRPREDDQQRRRFRPMIFGTGERLLLPFGLHHILVALIRFTEAGGTMDVCGHSVSGALTIFQAQLSCPTTHGFSESATRFLSQGKMPAFLGGLPGAALAMYHCARPENRHKIKGLLISGVIACVVGGTTEPLEFLFLFVAPVLYVIHALLTGLGFTIMAVLGVTIGNTKVKYTSLRIEA
jgi:PTS system maltose and glucose-specific IIC component